MALSWALEAIYRAPRLAQRDVYFFTTTRKTMRHVVNQF